MKTKMLFTFIAVWTAINLLLSASASARPGTTRTMDQILNYKILGVSLNTPTQKAGSILVGQGFALVGEPYPEQRSWKYKKGNITFAFEARHEGSGLQSIAFTENSSGDHFELDSRVNDIIQSWGDSPDGKPVCQTKALKGKTVLSECAVSDPEDRKAAYYAMMSIVQIQQRLSVFKK
jgi:hypothetical protein